MGWPSDALCSLVTLRSGVLCNRVSHITAAFLFVGYVMALWLTRYNVASIVRMMDESELERVSKEAVEALFEDNAQQDRKCPQRVRFLAPSLCY
jgi:hypothetical protein